MVTDAVVASNWQVRDGFVCHCGLAPTQTEFSPYMDSYCERCTLARCDAPSLGSHCPVQWTPTVANCDTYLAERQGHYDWRAIRYRAAVDLMRIAPGLSDLDTVFDIGAGWTELDFCLRNEYGWRGRYCPIDGGIDGTNLNAWSPPREAEWFVALEILEHLTQPIMLLEKIKLHASKGVVLSTPNPRTTDVLGMDDTHVTPIKARWLEDAGFTVQERSFYGQPADSLFAWWLA